jgi:hypothetical protein
LPKLLGATPYCGESGGHATATWCHTSLWRGCTVFLAWCRRAGHHRDQRVQTHCFCRSQSANKHVQQSTEFGVIRHHLHAGLDWLATPQVPWPARHWPHMHHRRKRSSTFAHLVESRVKLADELKPKRVDSAIVNPQRHNIACSRVPHRRWRKGSHWRLADTNNDPSCVPDALGSDRECVIHKTARMQCCTLPQGQ